MQSRSSSFSRPIVRLKAWLGLKDNSLRLAVIVAYITITLLGATTSSIGMPTLRQDPANPLGLQIGEPSPIRADEYNAFSPIALSIMATGGAPTTSVLAAAANIVHRYPSGGLFETFVFFDSTLLRTAAFLPDNMVFAAHWWLPALLLFLFLPKWFAQVGADRRWGWLAAALIALSPAASWWTMMPIQLMAYSLAGSSLLLSAYRRFSLGQRLLPVSQCLASGILLAGLPSFYIPWSLVLGLPLLASSAIWIMTSLGPWRPKIFALGTAGLTAIVFAAGMLWENRAGISALLETVYPGSRRSTGAAQAFSMLFGAPALGALRDMTPVGSNESELSTAFTITFVWAALLLVGINKAGKLSDKAVIAVMSLFGFLWLAWCTINFGERGAEIPLLNYVQPARAAQVCGILGTILVCLLLSRLAPGKNRRLATVSAAACGLVTAYAASSLQQAYLPNITLPLIAAATLAVAVCVFCILRFSDKIWPIALTAVLATLPVIGANPLIFGLGDLRASETATYLREEGRAAASSGEVWVTDSPSLDTVLLANGVPSLSGVQRSGPNKQAWAQLDPSSEHTDEWNRGGGFIYFEWIPGQPMVFGNNGSDSAIVRADPCDLKERVPNLAGLTSTHALSGQCLVPDRVLTWSSQAMFVYKFR